MDSKSLSLLTTEELVSLRDGLVQVVQNLQFLETLPDRGAEWRRQFSEIDEQLRLRGQRQNLENERGAESRTVSRANEPADEILQGIRGIVLDDRVSDKGKAPSMVSQDGVSFGSGKKMVPIVEKKAPAQSKELKKEPKKPLVAIMLDSDDEKELEERELQEEKAHEKRAAKRFLIEYAQKTSMAHPEHISKSQQSRLRFTGRKPKVNETIGAPKEKGSSNYQSPHPTRTGKMEASANQANAFESNESRLFGGGGDDMFAEESETESEGDDGEEFGQFLDEFGGGDVEFDEDEEDEGLGGIGGQGFNGFRYWDEGDNDYENQDDIDDDCGEDGGEEDEEDEGILGDIKPDSFSKYVGEGGDSIDFEALD